MNQQFNTIPQEQFINTNQNVNNDINPQNATQPPMNNMQQNQANNNQNNYFIIQRQAVLNSLGLDQNYIYEIQYIYPYGWMYTCRPINTYNPQIIQTNYPNA